MSEGDRAVCRSEIKTKSQVCQGVLKQTRSEWKRFSSVGNWMVSIDIGSQLLLFGNRARQLGRPHYVNLLDGTADLPRNTLRRFSFVEFDLDFDVQHNSLRHSPYFR